MHAHVGWLFIHTQRGLKTRYAPDLIADPIVSWISRTFLLWMRRGPRAAVPARLADRRHALRAALTGLLWGGAVRMLVLHHATYSINSLCHFFGRQRFKTGDESRNLWWLSVFTFGEAWHNNHHAFPHLGPARSRALPVRPVRVGHLGAREDRAGLGRRAHPPRATGRQARDVSGTDEFRSAIAEALPERPFTVALWDGSELPSTDGGGPTFRVRSPCALGHVLRAPSQLGVGRAYVSGGIDVDDIDAALALLARWSPPPVDPRSKGRIAVAALRAGAWRGVPRVPKMELRPRGRRHSIVRDKRSVTHHYSLSSDYFALFLDESMTYSCALWSRGATTLEEAQHDKLELVCTKLALRPGERVLDVGCGWGSFAIHAAREHGVHVTGITLSEPQACSRASAPRRPEWPTASTSASWTTASSRVRSSTRSPRSAWSSTSAA